MHLFYSYHIFALDSVVVKTQKLLSLHGGFLTYKRNNPTKLTHYDEAKKRAQDSQIARAKENLKWRHGPVKDKFLFYSNTKGTHHPVHLI